MTEGDLQFFMIRLDEGDGTVDSRELLANINFFIKDRSKRQNLESRIPEKLLVPLDETEKDRKRRLRQEKRERRK